MKIRGYKTLTVGFSLVLVLAGLLAYGTMVAERESGAFFDRTSGAVRMSVVVKDSLGEVQRGDMRRAIEAMDEVIRVEFTDTTAARAEFTAALGGHIPQLGVTLPASFEVYYSGGGKATARLVSRFSSMSGVRDVVYDPSLARDRDSLERSVTVAARVVFGGVGLVLLALLYFVVSMWVGRNAHRGDLVALAVRAAVVAGVAAGVVLVVFDQYLASTMPAFALGLSLALLVGSVVLLFGVAVAALFGFISIKSIER